MPHELDTAVVQIKTELSFIRKDIDKIKELLIEGNGNSIQSKMLLFDSYFKNINEDLSDIKKNRRLSFQSRIAIASALLSGGSAFLIIVLERLFSHG